MACKLLDQVLCGAYIPSCKLLAGVPLCAKVLSCKLLAEVSYGAKVLSCKLLAGVSYGAKVPLCKLLASFSWGAKVLCGAETRQISKDPQLFWCHMECKDSYNALRLPFDVAARFVGATMQRENVPRMPADRDFCIAAFGVLLCLSTLSYTLGGCGPPSAVLPPPYSIWDTLAALHLAVLGVAWEKPHLVKLMAACTTDLTWMLGDGVQGCLREKSPASMHLNSTCQKVHKSWLSWVQKSHLDKSQEMLTYSKSCHPWVALLRGPGTPAAQLHRRVRRAMHMISVMLGCPLDLAWHTHFWQHVLHASFACDAGWMWWTAERISAGHVISVSGLCLFACDSGCVAQIAGAICGSGIVCDISQWLTSPVLVTLGGWRRLLKQGGSRSMLGRASSAACHLRRHLECQGADPCRRR
eukprot:scaffold12693_cov19-Tisochrysis_lutea.AAC.2